MKTNYVLKVLPFVLGLTLFISCGEKKSQDQENESATGNAKPKVNVTETFLQPVSDLSTYTANVQADVVNQIIPTIPTRIEKIYVEVGTRVTKGQKLAQMESSNLRQQQTQLMTLKKDYNRYVELLKVGGVAQQQVDQLKSQLDVLQTAVANIEENTTLRSPINGVITARNYDNGDVFAQQPILTVEQLNPLKAVIYVSESYFAKVKTGMPAEIKLDVYGDELFSGNVSLVYPTIDAGTHTFGVEVTINNKDMRVRPGMYSRVTLNFGEHQSIVISDAAVQKQAGSNDRYVYVIEDGIAKYRKVELGLRLGDKYEILSGIKPGEVVVTAGQARLTDGNAVEILNKE
ncbi:MAG: efflux RND transporter periplasmic adaptor subunit [Dysgonamonadaceae bacterium]|jgi:RND family efflux transporter MFP subunit|nr:efflux RND transporter periplasmic adaptor subunit [Dysgonamonadaceae bacterium]